jgi:Flp pilus assembly protein TadG
MRYAQCSYSERRCQSGAVMIEFAIIVPFLFLMLIGIVEFGYAFYHANILNKSVQDGVRYFSNPKFARNGNLENPIDTNSTSNTNIQTTENLIIYGIPAVTDSDKPLLPVLANYTPAPVFYCIEENTSNKVCAEGTQHIGITVNYSHNLITGDLLSFLIGLFSSTNSSLGPTIPLTASAIMRVQ